MAVSSDDANVAITDEAAAPGPSLLARLVGGAMARPAIVLATVAVVVVAGVLAFLRLPFDAFPDLTGVRVEVITEAPGFAVDEVEQLVTYPIESVLMGLEGAEQVRSTSKSGLSLVTVAFEDGTDLYHARTLVMQRLGDAKGELPAGVDPLLGPVSTPLGELYQYVVESDSMSLTELKALHDYVIRPRLRSVAGVSEVNSWGGLIEQVQVQVNPSALASYGLTLQDVHDALAANSMAFGGSYIEKDGERWTLRGLGRIAAPAELTGIVVRAVNGIPVRVGDIATVEIGALPRFGAVSRDGTHQTVAGMVLKRKGEDSRRVIAGVLERARPGARHAAGARDDHPVLRPERARHPHHAHHPEQPHARRRARGGRAVPLSAATCARRCSWPA